MIVAVGEEFFTRASRTSPSISRFTRCDELWTDETFCLLPRGWISQQFQMPDLHVGTLDSLLTISDDLTKAKGLKIPPFAII
ncbi:hypothetical protein CY35_04G028500 [Sphagnum magellanicum]|nr:hypothetical protein CY35_04G028500 [Sphagnum magellanicum]KAH9564503.1 hypothetical protein CY35_04G028500 [Sphagnum magellanicum]